MRIAELEAALSTRDLTIAKLQAEKSRKEDEFEVLEYQHAQLLKVVVEGRKEHPAAAK